MIIYAGGGEGVHLFLNKKRTLMGPPGIYPMGGDTPNAHVWMYPKKGAFESSLPRSAKTWDSSYKASGIALGPKDDTIYHSRALPDHQFHI